VTKKLNVFEDSTLPAGAVVISINSHVADHSSLGLIVERKNIDRPYLGLHGWQAAEHVISPLSVRSNNGHAEMVFGGDVTRHVGVDMNVTLSVPTVGIRERHFWPAITAEQNSGGVIIQGKSVVSSPVTVSDRSTDSLTLDDVEVIPAQINANEPVSTEDSVPKTSRWMLIGSIAALLLVAIGIAFFFFTNSDEIKPPVEQVASAPSRAVEPPQPPPAPDFAERYRTYLGQQGHADALLALGREALAAQATDVGFNAVTLAADRGFAEAKLLLAQWYDPLFEERGLVRPNPNSAATYYAEATAGGSQEGSGALQRLCGAATTSPPPAWAQAFDTKTHCP
jgi:hypothetical protein